MRFVYLRLSGHCATDTKPTEREEKKMFTVEQIEHAHEKVKSGADFPKYIQEIKELGVVGFVTWVKDSSTEYFGENNFSTNSRPKYDELIISGRDTIKIVSIL